jgi:hypothetical protein
MGTIFYGHKENDTTRFPVSSTVLKYPHVAMTGPAQRGYVASASRQSTNMNRMEAFNDVARGTLSAWQKWNYISRRGF